jgi:NAD+ diphosphatase
MQRRNVFAGPYLDRAAHLREDPDWYEDALGDRRSRVIPVWNSRNFIADGVDPKAVFIDLEAIPAERRGISDLILLGEYGDASYFAYEFDSIDPPQLDEDGRFEDLRMIASLLPPDEAGLLGYARALISWRRRNRYCGSCGTATMPARGGHVLVCTNPACRQEQFPRLDPAIIVLIHDGPRALLGRQASWPVGRYSTIAGFVEPGESLEDAVAREVLEETGVEVDHIEYHSSQPWPFPSSLMLGFTAHAVTHEIFRVDQELEDARWFTRDDIAAGTPLLPPNTSISYRLIEHWFDAAGDKPLSHFQGAAAWPAN